MPQGVTALPISEGLSMGYIPVSLPAIQVNGTAVLHDHQNMLWCFRMFLGCTVSKAWRLSRGGERWRALAAWATSPASWWANCKSPPPPHTSRSQQARTKQWLSSVHRCLNVNHADIFWNQLILLRCLQILHPPHLSPLWPVTGATSPSSSLMINCQTI